MAGLAFILGSFTPSLGLKLPNTPPIPALLAAYSTSIDVHSPSLAAFLIPFIGSNSLPFFTIWTTDQKKEDWKSSSFE